MYVDDRINAKEDIVIYIYIFKLSLKFRRKRLVYISPCDLNDLRQLS